MTNSRESEVPAESSASDLAAIADVFESREFSGDELGAIGKTRRRWPKLGEAKAEAMGQVDRAAYQLLPEQHGSFWDDVQAWGAERA